MAKAEVTGLEVGNALFNECQCAFEFINSKVRAVLLGSNEPVVLPVTLPTQYKPGFLRAIAWLNTLSRCTSPSDYQAVFTASRTLLEIATDAALLHHTTDGPQILADWELSAKLKHASCMDTYYGSNKGTGEIEVARDFARRQRTRIDGIRLARGWTEVAKNGTLKPKHPNRWTNNNLAVDAKDASKFEPDLELERVYETEYRPACWAVHGSGAIGVSNLDADGVAFFAGRIYRSCSRQAVRYSRLLLKYAGVWEQPYLGKSWSQHFAELDEEQTYAVFFAAGGTEERLEELRAQYRAEQAAKAGK